MKLDTSIYGNTFLQKQLLVVCKNLSSKHLFTYFTYWKNDTVKVTFSRFIFLIDICLERRRGRWRFLFNTSLSCKFTSSVDLLYLNSSFFFLSCGYFTQQTCWKSTTEILEESVKYDVQSQQKKIPELFWCFYCKLVHISHIFLVFSLLTLNRYMFAV